MYGISQLEGLAVIWAIDKFRPYLSHQKFTLVTDHRALTKLREVKDNNPMLYRWSLKLAGYDYEVEYKKGEKHGNADGPSRNLVLNIDESNIEESKDHNQKGHSNINEEQILATVHNQAHLGFKKTYATIQNSFFWVGMSKHCNEYCKSCELTKVYTHNERSKIRESICNQAE
jgi:hypothetical protein